MNHTDKLRVLLPHWITHNMEHGKEFSRWADSVRNAGDNDTETVALHLKSAAAAAAEVTAALEKALETAGGALDHSDLDVHEHDHDHHHHHTDKDSEQTG